VPQPLWTPPPDRRDASALQRFLHRHGFESYDRAWEWSVDPATAGDFWAAAADDTGVVWAARPDVALEADASAVSGARWFRGGLLNYAENVLRDRPGAGAFALRALSDTRPPLEITWDGLRSRVAAARAGLSSAGVGRGSRVAGYLPNIPEALVTMLAAASLGALWSCCAPEMGVAGVLDRLGQVEPDVLVAVDGYRYGAREISRREEAEAIRAGLPTLRSSVLVDYLEPGSAAPGGWTPWREFVAADGPLAFEPVPFEHPLYILYSSGTTGKPKAIVHGHGGITVEHAKALRYHFDLVPGDVFFWFSTTGWMMWNFCVSGLLAGATVVLFDGDPSGPGGDRLWKVMAATSTTCGGVGAGYLVAGARATAEGRPGPGAVHDLSALATLRSTGSPLPAAAAEWVYRAVSPQVLLASFSGGTDVCTGFVGASPLHPVWPGEISGRCLGARVEVFDESGRGVTDEEGELVVTAPLPSMPVGILGDSDGSRYRATYFERYPGVWAHGDRATITSRGTVIITGRSDGTLNRGGVRMGTAEFYAVVEAIDGVADSLAVHLEDPGGGPGELLLFVVAADASLDGSGREDLAQRIRASLRADLSPRHVPDLVEFVPAVPRTLSGKKLEVPVKRILAGVAPADAVALPSVADPASLDPFAALARSRAGPAG
jgi:acetoacetyl-CoA synthetase